MSPLRQLHRRLTWLALFAALVGALVPTLSHAVAARSDAARMEVCTALGAKWVVVATDGTVQPDPTPAPLHGGLEHCLYCALGTVGAPLPSTLSMLLLPRTGGDRPLGRRLVAVRTTHPWQIALPRAPPAAS